MNNLQQAARILHACGFKTLPIRPGEKIPATPHGVKDATMDDAATDAYFEHKGGHGIGVSGEGFIIFDLDCHGEVDGRETLLDWELEHGQLPDTLRQTTPSGGEHLIYRSAEEVRPSVNGALAVDVRAWGSYVVCEPTPGYCWEQYPTADVIADADARVLEFLQYVRPAKKSTFAVGGAQGVHEGGRNDYLFREGCGAHAKNVSGAELLAYLEAKNKLDCHPPLPTAEVEKIAASVDALPAGYSPEVKAKQRTNIPNHLKYGKALIKDRCACMIGGIDGTPAIIANDGMSYRLGWSAVVKAHLDLNEGAKIQEQREVRNYIKYKAPEAKLSPPSLIAFSNGVLDLDTMQLRDFIPTDVIPNVIPHRWNPDAECEDVDKVLARISAGDPTVEMNLCEFAGLCMYRESDKYGYMAVLLGREGQDASNGKSTYIRMIANMLGRENYSSIDLQVLGENFTAHNIAGKLANLADDIPTNFMKSNAQSIVKKMVTGETVWSDVKHMDGVTFNPYATIIVSANAMPSFEDTTDGWIRRLFPIRFNAHFSPSDADFDPDIRDKLSTEAAAERLIVRGIAGLKRVIEQRQPTPNAESSMMKQDVRLNNNNVLLWIADQFITAEDCEGKTPQAVMKEYRDWCEESGLKGKGMPAFGRILCAELGLVSTPAKVDGKTVRYYQRSER